MNTKSIAEQASRIAPRYSPAQEDISWLEIELGKVAEKALPRLIKKRFAQSFVDALDSKTPPRVSGVAVSAPKQTAAPTEARSSS